MSIFKLFGSNHHNNHHNRHDYNRKVDILKELMDLNMNSTPKHKNQLCHSCQSENTENSKFCSKCGNKLGLKIICKNCGNPNLGNSKFCTECGEKN